MGGDEEGSDKQSISTYEYRLAAGDDVNIAANATVNTAANNAVKTADKRIAVDASCGQIQLQMLLQDPAVKTAEINIKPPIHCAAK